MEQRRAALARLNQKSVFSAENRESVDARKPELQAMRNQRACYDNKVTDMPSESFDSSKSDKLQAMRNQRAYYENKVTDMPSTATSIITRTSSSKDNSAMIPRRSEELIVMKRRASDSNASVKKLPQPSVISQNDIKTDPSELGNESRTSFMPPQGMSGSLIKWMCNHCQNECIPIIRESRCLCGHRLKDHPQHVNPKNNSISFPCKDAKCKCKHFFYIVAEGAWILRCKCKHKHIEHNCAEKPFYCQKCPPPGSSSTRAPPCTGFDSPWVCNCGHPWGQHTQISVGAASTKQDDYSSTSDAPLLDLPPGAFGKSSGQKLPSGNPVSRKQFALRQDGY